MSLVITENIGFTDTITETLTYGLTSLPAQASESPTYSWPNGSAANEVNERFEHEYTLASSASTTLTLSALTDDLGRSIAFANVRKISVWLKTFVDPDFLTLGGASTHVWSAIPTYEVYGLDVKVFPGTGFAVSSGSSDQLKITNSGSNSITFIIAISGS